MIRKGRDLPLLAAAILPVIAVFVLFDPYPQPASYHEFADTRTLAGTPNFWNVASNVLFLVFGIAGLRLLLWSDRLAILPELRTACFFLYAGIAMTALGSGWFHLAPDNNTLFWDRLPMTVAFMSLFSIIIGEHLSAKLGQTLLWPLLASGVASVLYWDYTESAGAGDLRFYGIVQFLPMLLIPAVLIAYRSAFNTIRFLWITVGFYVLAKLFELLDGQIYSAGSIISGHSLKHVVASLVPLVLIHGMKNRKRIE
jgi:hypothetical protein